LNGRAHLIGGQRAWLKRTVPGVRRWRLCVSWPTVCTCRPCARRRIVPAAARGRGPAPVRAEAQQVNVPKVIGQARDTLVLSDTGDSLNARLRQVRDDPALLDAMVSAALAAIADGHRKGAYFGQPVPRNMTWAEGKVGFLDFEEDRWR
jgi:hypothetical protein